MSSYLNEPESKKIMNQLLWMKAIVRILWFFGLVKTNEMIDSINNIKTQWEKIMKNIDSFNSWLWSLGWPLFHWLNIDSLHIAIEEYENWNIEKTEDILIEEVNKNLQRYKKQFRNKIINAFEIRKNLLSLSIKDYEEKRYHSCIPVFLLCVDWIVNDIAPEQKWLFAEWEHMIIPNSIVWYKWSLHKTIQLLSSTRKKTTTEDIFIPYRNGILHGRDINYYNIKTATKCLSLLFAIFDWAVDKKKYDQKLKKEENKKTLRESIKDSYIDYQDLEKQKKWINNRMARDKSTISIIIQNKIFNENTPEKFILENFDALKNKRFWIITEDFKPWIPIITTKSQYISKLKDILLEVSFVNFEIISITDTAPAISEIEYQITYTRKEKEEIKNINQRLVYMDQKWNSMTRNTNWWRWYWIRPIDYLLNLY